MPIGGKWKSVFLLHAAPPGAPRRVGDLKSMPVYKGRMNPSRLAFIALIWPTSILCGAACSTTFSHTIGPVGCYTTEPNFGAASPLSSVTRLAIPRNAILRIAPRWFSGELTHEGRQGPQSELQLLIRARTVDNGTVSWFFDTTSASAELSHGGNHDSRRHYHLPFGGKESGEIRVKALVALEFLVATLDSPQDGADPYLKGAARLAMAPGVHTTARQELDVMESAVRQAGGTIELAVRLPIVLTDKQDAYHEVRWFVAVEDGPLAKRVEEKGDVQDSIRSSPSLALERRGTSAGPMLRSHDGQPVPFSGLLVVSITTEVVDHGKPRAPGEIDSPDEKNKRPPNPLDQPPPSLLSHRFH
jgi:hypothetical protein